MAPVQKPAQALVSAIRHGAAPLAVHPSVNAASVEDDATNSALAVLRLDDMLDLLALLIAIELVCAAQAVDLARPVRLGEDTRSVHRRVRELVAPVDVGRPLTADIEAVAAMVG
jgi:histidine ammonia-lyase